MSFEARPTKRCHPCTIASVHRCAELHERNCPQRRLLEVQRAITNNLRVRVVSGEGAAAKGSKKRAAPSDDAEGAPGKRAAASEE